MNAQWVFLCCDMTNEGVESVTKPFSAAHIQRSSVLCLEHEAVHWWQGKHLDTRRPVLCKTLDLFKWIILVNSKEDVDSLITFLCNRSYKLQWKKECPHLYLYKQAPHCADTLLNLKI